MGKLSLLTGQFSQTKLTVLVLRVELERLSHFRSDRCRGKVRPWR